LRLSSNKNEEKALHLSKENEELNKLLREKNTELDNTKEELHQAQLKIEEQEGIIAAQSTAENRYQQAFNGLQEKEAEVMALR